MPRSSVSLRRSTSSAGRASRNASIGIRLWPAGDRLGVAVVRRQQRHGLRQRGRAGVVEAAAASWVRFELQEFEKNRALRTYHPRAGGVNVARERAVRHSHAPVVFARFGLRAPAEGAIHARATDDCDCRVAVLRCTRRHRNGGGAKLPLAADQDRRAGGAGRTERHSGATGVANPAFEIGTAGGGGASPRSRRRARLALGRRGAPRRPYAAVGRHRHAGGDAGALSHRRLRSPDELRPGGEILRGLHGSRRPPVLAVAHGAGPRGLCQGQSGQGQLRPYRHRQHSPPVRRAVHAEHGHAAGGRALSQRRRIPPPRC